MTVRLVNGGSSCVGTVQVYHDGQWGTVDGSGDYGWDMKAAAVVCKELGCGVALSAPGGAHFGVGSGPVVTYDVRCRGMESTLRSCQSKPWGHRYWLSHSYDVGVFCSEGVRLVNGRSPCAGTVEVYHRGQWGTVQSSGYYGQSWDMKAAAVVCKELGCGAALSAPGGAHFGRGSGPIVTYAVRCRGSESTLRECPSDPWGRYYWTHQNDAGVSCSDPLEKPIISLTPDYRVFVRGESAQISCSGNYPGSKFSLYRSDKLITSQPVPEKKKTATFTLSEISAGSYWCNYRTHMGGREFISPDSEQVSISLWDPLQKPKVSLNPDFQEFARGDSVEISCSGNYPGSNFSLHGDGELLTSQAVPENNKTATFTSMEISAGNYTCKYTKVIDGREFTSPESEAAGISVIDPLQKPNISLKPDTQVFARGERAEISCTGNYPGSNFTLYRNGEFIISQTATENTYTATFTPSEITAGNYTCIYATYTDRRQFTSPESERLGIPVRVNLTWLHIEGLVAGVVTAIVITVFILGFCANKRRKQKSQREERSVLFSSIPCSLQSFQRKWCPHCSSLY
uniref:Alpha-1B-glycoprotein-like n=1 Tax=Callorhinchus milii TaxID=7868 RepID=A0A4W3GG99_CALMI